MKNKVSLYGAGQPSVVYRNGYFYMIYTDTTGAASNPDFNTLYPTKATKKKKQIMN